MTTVYVAGPMTGLPDHNYPAFHAAEALLTDAGYRVLNPARNGTIPGDACAACMRLGLRQVLEADAVALLPGWEASRGARLEREVALALGLPVAPLVGGGWGDGWGALPPNGATS